ncbi:MAG: glycosyltransferase family 8 protein [Holosporaceae bacterium]|nr:glycosyltransferase family 8 protein [Holosporaceae bacterium]
MHVFVKRCLLILMLPFLSFGYCLSETNIEVKITKLVKDVKPAFPNDNVSIVFGCDDNYAMYLGVCLQSLIETSSEKHNYDIWILEGNISENNRRGIINLIKGRKNFSIRFFNIDDFVEKNKEKFRIFNKHLTVSTYYRLFIPQIFSNYRRMLYLDCDIIINSDISELFNVDMNGKSVGAVKDRSMCTNSRKYVKRIKGKKNGDYFNAGVMLFNIDKTARENITDKCLEYLFSRKDGKDEFLEDQDALNAVCIDNVKLIDGRWNVLMYGYYLGMNKGSHNIINFYIVHYFSSKKPWMCSTPLDAIWWRYAARTSFYHDILARNRNLIIFHIIRIRVVYFLVALLQWLHMDDLIWKTAKLRLSLIARTMEIMKDMAAFKHLKFAYKKIFFSIICNV